MPPKFKMAPAGVNPKIASIPHMSPRELAAFMAKYGSFTLPFGGFSSPGNCGSGWVPFQANAGGSPSLAQYLSAPYYKKFAVMVRVVPSNQYDGGAQVCVAMTPYYAVVKTALTAGLGIQVLWPASPWQAMSGMGVDDPAAYQQPTSWWSLRSKHEKTAILAGGALASIALLATLRSKRAT